MKRIRQMRLSVSFLILISFAVPMSADNVEETEQNEFQFSTTGDANRSTAIQLLDEVDAMRAEWENLSIGERRSSAGQQEQSIIQDLYENIVDLAPGTPIASYALFNIMGMHTSARDLIQTKQVYQRILTTYPGTMQEVNAHMHMGLTYLQSVGNPDKALVYFEQIGNPRDEEYAALIYPGGKLRNKDSAELDMESIAYIRARLQMTRCFLNLGQLDNAEMEINNLKSGYPAASQWIDTEMKSFNDEFFHMSSNILDKKLISDDILKNAGLEDIPKSANMSQEEIASTMKPELENLDKLESISDNSVLMLDESFNLSIKDAKEKPADQASPILANLLLACSLIFLGSAGVLSVIKISANRTIRA